MSQPEIKPNSDTYFDRIIKWCKNHPIVAPLLVLISALGVLLIIVIDFQKVFICENKCEKLMVIISERLSELEEKVYQEKTFRNRSDIRVILDEFVKLKNQSFKEGCKNNILKMDDVDRKLILAIIQDNEICDKLIFHSPEQVICINNTINFCDDVIEYMSKDKDKKVKIDSIQVARSVLVEFLK